MIVGRIAAGLLSGSGRRARLSTLIFHRVRAESDPTAPRVLHAAQFDQMLRWIGEVFTVLPPDEAVARLAQGDLPPRAMAITFDDGYADNAEVALPILQRHGMKAAFFVATDFLDGGMMWNDRIAHVLRNAPAGALDLSPFGLPSATLGDLASRRKLAGRLIGEVKYRHPEQRLELIESLRVQTEVELPTNVMMTSEQVRSLRAAGMVIGGHTCSHPILASLDATEAEREILDNKARLEAILGESIKVFAYPNGGPGKDYRVEHVRMVAEAGYQGAFTTGWGCSRHGDDLFQIARFTPWDQGHYPFITRLLQNLRRPATTV